VKRPTEYSCREVLGKQNGVDRILCPLSFYREGLAFGSDVNMG